MRKFKSIFVLLLTAISVWSCSDKNEIIQEPDQPVMEKVKVQLTATLGTDTRTSLATDGSKVLWGVGDEISVFHNGAHSKFVSQNTEPSETAVFEGYVEVPAGGSVGTLYGVYPYSSSNQQPANDDRFIVTLPDLQTAVEETFADDLSISVGKSSGLSMTFYNLCGLVEFTVDRDDIVKVTLKDKNEAKSYLSLAGRFLVNFNTDRPQATSLDPEYIKTEISIANSDDSPLKKGAKYYMVVVPQSFDKEELSFELLTEEDEVLEKVITESVTIGRSKIKSFLKVDEGAVSTQYVDFGDDVVFKNYCLTNFDSNKDGKISKDEAKVVNAITGVYNVESLKGIEDFVNISQLNVQGIKSEGKLDLSNNSSLAIVEIAYSNVSEIMVSSYSNIYLLNIRGNLNLTTLSAKSSGSFKNLNTINVVGAQVKGLDLTLSSKLYSFSANDISDFIWASNTYMQLSHIEISGNNERDYNFTIFPNITSLIIRDFKTLDLSGVTKLENLHFGSSVCESVDLSACPELYEIEYYGSKLKSLDVSSCEELKHFTSVGSGLPKLIVGIGQDIVSDDYIDPTTQIVQKGSSSTEAFTRD